jgi:hypothetical protein
MYLPRDLLLDNYFTSNFDQDEIRSIDNEDYKFNGYLVIKIDSLSQIDTDVSYRTTVIWVNSFTDIYDYNKCYWYFPYVGTILKLAKSYMSHMDLKNDYKRNNIYNFIKYYLVYNENNTECQSFLYKDTTSLKTNIISNDVKLWKGFKDEKATYIIFRASFVTAIVTLKIPIIYSQKQRIENVRILIPTTPLMRFEPVTENEALENRFSENSTLKIVLK